ncbi:MAG: PAS domain S-box protein [Mycobacteriales bacterium]
MSRDPLGGAPAVSPDRLSEAVLRAASGYSIIACDLDGTITVFNPGAESLLGYRAEEMIGKQTPEVFHDPSEVAARAAELGVEPGFEVFLALARGGQSETREWTYVCKDGGRRTVSLTVSVVSDSAGEVVGSVGVARDVTDEQRAAEELARSAQRFSAVFAANPVPTIITRVADGLIVMANPAWPKALGWAPEELVGHTATEVGFWVHPETRVALLETLRSQGFVADLEAEVGTRSGERRRVLISAHPVELNGETHLIGLFYDITERKRVEAALAESEQLFRQLAEAVGEVFALRTLEPPEFLYVSPACEEIYGFAPETVYRDPMAFLAVVHSEDRPWVGERMRSLAAAGGRADLEYRIVRADGTARWVRVKASPVIGAGGGVSRVALTIEDVTARKAAEEASRIAREEANRANGAKSEFLSRMSHELRTPLNAILGFAQLLDLDQPSGAQRESVGHILRGGRHLLELINEVLDISRIEAGQLRVSLEPVLVADALDDALGLVRPLATARQLRLPSGSPAGACAAYVRADRQRLAQVLLNLLSNAVKYNRNGGEVTVDCDLVAPETLRLAVTDTGIGIPDAYLGRLFTPFERFGAEASEVEGTGLGLALTKYLVEAMGGRIGASSEVGRGSTFWVELPTVAPPEGAPLPAEAPSAPRSLPAALARSVLYVEDNVANVRLLEAILARRPEVTLLVAMRASLGLELAVEHRPALVLLDLNLPDMAGEEVLRRLRADPGTAGIPVVVISADATAGQLDRLRAAGATDYLTKPFDVTRVLALVDAYGPGGSSGTTGTALTGSALAHQAEPGRDGPLDEAVLTGLRELGGLRAGAGRAAGRLVGVFLAEAPKGIERLRAALGAADPAELEAAAHSLRGSAASFGAHRMAERCSHLETLGSSGELSGAAELLAGLEADFAVAQAALRGEFPDAAD